MKRRLLRRRWLIPIGFLLLPPLFWAAVLLIAPTEWARTRIIARLSKTTGRPVALGSLRIGALGGIRLADLEIGAPDKPDDPWLRVARARINISLLQLMLGKGEPTDIQVEGLTLRVLRRRDGTLELSDMLLAGPSDRSASPSNASEPCPIEAAGVDVRFRDARIVLIDKPTRTRLVLAGAEGRATWLDRKTAVHELRGKINGGAFELVASLDQSVPEPVFEGHLHASGIALNEDMDALAYLVPIVGGDGVSAGSLDGRLDAIVYLRGQGITRTEIRRSLIGEGRIALDPVHLDGSRFLDELADVIDLPPKGRVGSVKTEFKIKGGKVSTDALTLNIAKLPIILSGWTDFDGRVDYRVRSDLLTERIPSQARDLLSDLSIDLEGLSALRVQGTVDALDITVDSPGREKTAGGTTPTRRPIRDITRQLRERLLR